MAALIPDERPGEIFFFPMAAGYLRDRCCHLQADELLLHFWRPRMSLVLQKVLFDGLFFQRGFPTFVLSQRNVEISLSAWQLKVP